jgi:hypothetical protein
MIQGNGDKYCKNPYFLHSIATHAGPKDSFSQFPAAGGNFGTISEYGGLKSNKQSNKVKSIQGHPESGAASEYPPRLKKRKMRPFSAPKDQNLKSIGLKNKVMKGNQHNRPMTGYKDQHAYMNH